MEPINLAAIDIGTNAARLLIKRISDGAGENECIKKILFIRIPLRLGKDVFIQGKISKEREHMMIHMMKGFKEFMLLYNIKKYRACATSAMRDAENGRKIIKKIKGETDIELEIIRGEEEAQLLCNNIIERTNNIIGNYAYVDVGGGSTEISLLHNGILAESHSFDIGTLRWLSGKVKNKTIREMKTILRNYSSQYPDINIIGSGGNINKLCKLIHDKDYEQNIKIPELKVIYEKLSALDVEERKKIYKLKDDRADVILPAAEIFLLVSEALQSEMISVPNISLADCIVDGLYQGMKNRE